QLVAPTVEGPAWFKANAPGLAHEPALHALLASIAPDRVDAPLAIDTERGWMLTRDRGSTLADDHDASLEEWCEIVREAADLQRRVVPHAASLLGTGLPNCSPTTVLERFELLIDRYAALPPNHPSHLSIDERQAFEAVRPDVAEAAATLAAGLLPVTLDHGDLHPGNVLLVGGGLRLFDFGDAQWASAPETLGAMWGWLDQLTPHPWRTIFAAYAEVWSDLVTQAEFDILVRAAMVTLPVNRSLTWWESTVGGTDEELREWGDAPLSQLRHLLRPWP
ncbi:MAG: phosphotransferase, partial [Nostocoides sp.]